MNFATFSLALADNGFVLQTESGVKLFKDDETNQMMKEILLLAKVPVLEGE